jgi:uncharacterized protein (DUF2267 family)
VDAIRDDVLHAIAKRANLPREIGAPDALSAVMCTLSRRVSGGEARNVYLGLPESLRPLVAQCILHRDERASVFDRDEFIARLSDHLATDAATAEAIARAVFAAVRSAIPDSEVRHVADQLPDDFRELWLSA